jgi:hypothetical protein
MTDSASRRPNPFETGTVVRWTKEYVVVLEDIGERSPRIDWDIPERNVIVLCSDGVQRVRMSIWSEKRIVGSSSE